mgnify:CR=1 FL=1
MKIKAMQFISIICLIIGLTSMSLCAQDSSGSGGGASSVSAVLSTLPIQSQDALREYALANVDHGARYVNSDSMDWNYPGAITYISTNGNGAEDVLDKLFGVEFVYSLTNPNDKIHGYVYLYDKNNRLLFFGYAEYTADDLKKSKPTYNIWIQSVPILSNVQSAEVLALDADGHTARHYYLEVDQYGQVIFQPWMAGSPNGILVVRFKDGSTLTYDLANPIGETPGMTDELAAYKIDGHYIYNANGEKKLTIKIIELWNRPTAFVRSAIQQDIMVDVMGVVQDNGTTTFERPISMIVTPEGKDRGYLIPLNGSEPTRVLMPIGNFRIKWNWIKFGQPNMLYTGPDGGGGKG